MIDVGGYALADTDDVIERLGDAIRLAHAVDGQNEGCREEGTRLPDHRACFPVVGMDHVWAEPLDRPYELEGDDRIVTPSTEVEVHVDDGFREEMRVNRMSEDRHPVLQRKFSCKVAHVAFQATAAGATHHQAHVHQFAVSVCVQSTGRIKRAAAHGGVRRRCLVVRGARNSKGRQKEFKLADTGEVADPTHFPVEQSCLDPSFGWGDRLRRRNLDSALAQQSSLNR